MRDCRLARLSGSYDDSGIIDFDFIYLFIFRIFFLGINKGNLIIKERKDSCILFFITLQLY